MCSRSNLLCAKNEKYKKILLTRGSSAQTRCQSTSDTELLPPRFKLRQIIPGHRNRLHHPSEDLQPPEASRGGGGGLKDQDQGPWFRFGEEE